MGKKKASSASKQAAKIKELMETIRLQKERIEKLEGDLEWHQRYGPGPTQG